MRAITMFNNKGGVGKTTLLCNLAAFLALERKHSVLVIDADPQCNATQSLFRDRIVDDIYENGRFTLYDVVQPLAQGKGYSKQIKPRRSISFGVDVIPGDPRLALEEDLLATDWGQVPSGNTRGLRTTFLFGNLLQRCQNYDFVFFDVGPSLSAINRSVLLASDYFISPMSTDIFSLRAVANISTSFEKWRRLLQLGLEQNQEPAELEVDRPDWHLQFAGYVTQQYTAKRGADGERRPVKAYDAIMKRIPEEIKRNFLATTDNPLPIDRYRLGSIPTFHSLIPMSQTSRKPIFELKAADGVVGAHFTKVREFYAIVSEVADNLLANLDELGEE